MKKDRVLNNLWKPADADDLSKEEPVSEDLEEAAKRYATEGDETSGLYIIDEEVEAFKAGAKWQKHQIMKDAVEIAREEMIEKVCSFISNNMYAYIAVKNANTPTFIEIDYDRFENDLKQAMKDEQERN